MCRRSETGASRTEEIRVKRSGDKTGTQNREGGGECCTVLENQSRDYVCARDRAVVR
jgi:hypothetical protein